MCCFSDKSTVQDELGPSILLCCLTANIMAPITRSIQKMKGPYAHSLSIIQIGEKHVNEVRDRQRALKHLLVWALGVIRQLLGSFSNRQTGLVSKRGTGLMPLSKRRER
jgi:hypothetical protein